MCCIFSYLLCLEVSLNLRDDAVSFYAREVLCCLEDVPVDVQHRLAAHSLSLPLTRQ